MEPCATSSCKSALSSSSEPSQTCTLTGVQCVLHFSTYERTFAGRSFRVRRVGISVVAMSSLPVPDVECPKDMELTSTLPVLHARRKTYSSKTRSYL